MAEPTVSRSGVAAIRVVASPAALDASTWPADATVLRLAPDEILLVDALDTDPPEPDAIVFPDTSWVRFVLTPDDGVAMMAHAAAWPAPSAGMAQGLVAGIAVKVVVGDPWWVLVPAVVAAEFEQRLREGLA